MIHDAATMRPDAARTDARAAISGALAQAADWADLACRLAPLGLLIEAEGAEPLAAVRRAAPTGAPLH